MEQNVKSTAPGQDETSPSTSADFDHRRREALLRLGAMAGYAVPVTVAALSMKAKATSFSAP